MIKTDKNPYLYGTYVLVGTDCKKETAHLVCYKILSAKGKSKSKTAGSSRHGAVVNESD